MQYGIGDSGNTLEAGAIIQVAGNRQHAERAQFLAGCRMAHQGEYPVAARQQRNGAHRHVSAADDQQAFHGIIML